MTSKSNEVNARLKARCRNLLVNRTRGDGRYYVRTYGTGELVDFADDIEVIHRMLDKFVTHKDMTPEQRESGLAVRK